MKKLRRHRLLCLGLSLACILPTVPIVAEEPLWETTFTENYGEDVTELGAAALTLTCDDQGSGMTDSLEADSERGLVRKLKFKEKTGSETSKEGTAVFSSLSGFASSFTGDVKNRLSFDFKMEGDGRMAMALTDTRAQESFKDSPWTMFVRPQSILFKPAALNYGAGTDWVEVLAAASAENFITATIDTKQWNRITIELDKTSRTGYVYLNDGTEPITEITTVGTLVSIDSLAALCFETPVAVSGTDMDPVVCIDNVKVEKFVGENHVKGASAYMVGGGQVAPNEYVEGILDYVQIEFYRPVNEATLNDIKVFYEGVEVSCQPAKVMQGKTIVRIYTNTLPQSGDRITISVNGVKLGDGREVPNYEAEFYAYDMEKVFTISDLTVDKKQVNGSVAYIANTSLINTTDQEKTAYVIFSGYELVNGIKKLVDINMEKLVLAPQSKMSVGETGDVNVSYSDGGEVYDVLLSEDYDGQSATLPYYGHPDGSGMQESYVDDGKGGYARKLAFKNKAANKEVYAGIGGLKALKTANDSKKMSIKFDMKVEGSKPVAMFATRGAAYTSQGHLTGIFGTDKAFGLWVAPFQGSGDFRAYSELTYAQASTHPGTPHVKQFVVDSWYSVEYILDFVNKKTDLYLDGQKLAEQTGLSNPDEIENLMFNIADAVQAGDNAAIVMDNMVISEVTVKDSKCDAISLCVIDATKGLPLSSAINCMN